MSAFFIEIVKFKLKRGLEHFPFFYIKMANAYARLRGDVSERVVTKDSVICIEGYPRCANSFAWHAFIKYTGIDTGIATHLHSSAQVRVALKLGVPTIVNIRNPRSCITSLQALSIQYPAKPDRPVVFKLEHYLNWYIYFYESLMPFKKQIIVADFKETISDFESILQRLNQQHDNRFKINLDSGSQEVGDGILEETQNQGHLGPNKERDEIKAKLTKNYDSSDLQTLKRKAEQIYQEFIN